MNPRRVLLAIGLLMIVGSLAGFGVEFYHTHQFSPFNTGVLTVIGLWGWLLAFPEVTKANAATIIGWAAQLRKGKDGAA